MNSFSHFPPVQYKAASAAPIEGFVILYREFDEFDVDAVDQEIIIPGAGVRSHVIVNLKPNTDYQIRIKSFNMAGRSHESNQVVSLTRGGKWNVLSQSLSTSLFSNIFVFQRLCFPTFLFPNIFVFQILCLSI